MLIINYFMLKPLYPYPALLLEKGKRYLIIADLHIGFEEQYCKRGIMIDESYIDEMYDDIKALVYDTDPDNIVLLGDVKDSIARISKSEWKLIPDFIYRISRLAKVIIIPGNHDNNINKLIHDINNVEIASIHGMLIDDTLLMHGHTLPSILNVDRMIIGHIHPRIVKEDSIVNGERVWIFLKIDKSILNSKGMMDIIIIPTFNRYLRARSVYNDSIIPLLKRVYDKIIDCLIITLDGSMVGGKDMLQYVLI